jgi:hypothetical protein
MFLLFLALGFVVESQAAVGVRLIMGLTDSKSEKWDGSVTATGARVLKLEQWRFDVEAQPGGTWTADQITGPTSWQLATHRVRVFGGGRLGQPAFVANGIFVWLDGESNNTQLNVKTAQGNFTVRLADIPYGKSQKLLDGRVMADRVPPSSQITNTPEEQDYPAVAAGKNGDIWLAYVEFKHNPDHDRIRHNFVDGVPPKNFDDMTAPTGGDQVLVSRFSGNAWGQPIAITPPGGDLNRPSIAVDGSGRPWVFWSENRKGNFDIWCRVIENGKPGATIQISTEPGSDIDPVAATDAKGRVWVAWQGWRNGKASIFSSTQAGDRFSGAAVVASSARNEWNPAIAADKEGHVTVAWDSYRNGNYDIFARTASSPGTWAKEVAIADSARYEAYPSIAYGNDGKLWIAYEEGSERWGKDWGALDTNGVAVYQGRAVRLVALDRGGKIITTGNDVGAMLPGVPVMKVDEFTAQSEFLDWLQPNPEAAKERRPSASPVLRRSPRNNLPRLTADSSGRLWLTFRSAFPMRWSVIGSVWSEYVASYDGNSWTGPIYLAHSDNLLDNRPAVVSVKAGELVVVGSADGRGNYLPGLAGPVGAAARARGRAGKAKGGAAAGGGVATAVMGNIPVKDAYNNDLYAATVSLAPASGSMAVKATPAVARAGADPMDKIEIPAIQRMRSFRLKNNGVNLRLVRGEFHRHSEISMDGGGDGTILDQWRYIIDAAGLDWVGCCDHDNGGGREYSWWITQKETDIFYAPGRFAPMFSYERSVGYPEGHRNVLFVQRGVRPLPRLPKVEDDSSGHAPDTQMLYAYLKKFDGVVASHTSGTNMGTDWRDNDPNLEPVVEIYQGERQSYEMPGAPRTNSENDSIGAWRPKGFISLALEMGIKFGFQASSDHISTHMSYCNIFVTDDTREAVLQGLKKRHVYGATDNILADVRSGPHMMGDAFATSAPPELEVKLTGTAPFAKVHIIKDNKYVYSAEPKKAQVEFTWKDAAAESGKTSYYYVRGEQENGEIVWVSPMWITYK